MEQVWNSATVPFRVGSAERLAIMEAMVVLGLLLLIALAGSLYAVVVEFRTHSRPTRRDLLVTVVAVGVVAFLFFWPPMFFFAFPFGTVVALAPGLASFMAADYPAMAGLAPAILASVLPLGRLVGWWEQCHCPLAFLVGDPGGLVILFVVPILSIAMLSYAIGLGARWLYSGRGGHTK